MYVGMHHCLQNHRRVILQHISCSRFSTIITYSESQSDDEPQDEDDEEAEREWVEHVVSVAARQKPSDLWNNARY